MLVMSDTSKGIWDLREWTILIQISLRIEVETNECRWLCVSNSDSHLLTVSCFVLVVLCGTAIWSEWRICSLYSTALAFLLVDWTDDRPFMCQDYFLLLDAETLSHGYSGRREVSLLDRSNISWSIKQTLFSVAPCYAEYNSPRRIINYIGLYDLSCICNKWFTLLSTYNHTDMNVLTSSVVLWSEFMTTHRYQIFWEVVGLELELTSAGCSVGIVRSRTQAMEFFLFWYDRVIISIQSECWNLPSGCDTVQTGS
jgi:hypothetical protein